METALFAILVRRVGGILDQSTVSSHQKSGSVFGSTLLIAGCCIGAGMLGFPVLATKIGFFPALLAMALSCIFMISTGLLVLEVTLWYGKDTNLITMAQSTMGNGGKYACYVVFIFLFYSLLVSYISGSGIILQSFLTSYVNVLIPEWVGKFLSVIVLGSWIYAGTRSVDRGNRILILGMVCSYIILLITGFSHIQPKRLLFSSFDFEFLRILPIMLIAFGFQNLVPSLAHYLGRDVKRIRSSIILGCSLPFVIYAMWQLIILGLISSEQVLSLQAGDLFITDLIKQMTSSKLVLGSVNYFAFFAIATSLLTIALSCVDFFADAFKLQKSSKNRAFLCCLVLLPPFLLSLCSTNLFHTALSYAGGIGAVLIYGIMPVLMVWVGRYSKALGTQRLLPGGRISLALILIFSCLILGFQISHL